MTCACISFNFLIFFNKPAGVLLRTLLSIMKREQKLIWVTSKEESFAGHIIAFLDQLTSTWPAENVFHSENNVDLSKRSHLVLVEHNATLTRSFANSGFFISSVSRLLSRRRFEIWPRDKISSLTWCREGFSGLSRCTISFSAKFFSCPVCVQ